MDNARSNIVLTGMTGCGKTTVGKLLADKLGSCFIDTDRLVEEKTGCTISQLFQNGEEHFRKLETEAVLGLEGTRGAVIATGGGVVKKPANMESLGKNGVIIYIDRPVADIAGDIDTGKRPLLAGGTARLAQLYEQRADLYRKYSDYTVLNKGTLEKLVQDILDIIKKALEGQENQIK